MPRRAKGLTAAGVAKAKKPGRYGDGGGLYLLVRSAELKFWLFRFVDPHNARTDKDGRPVLSKTGRPMPWLREMGLGPAAGPSAVPLAEARDTAAAHRALLRAGINPLDKKREAKRPVKALVTFGAAAKAYIEAQEAGWQSATTKEQWEQSLRDHAGALTDKPVADVSTSDVSAVLSAIWKEKTETAAKLRGRIESILSFAKIQGWRDGENPARWRGHLDQTLPKPSRVRRIVHYPALPWLRVPAFMADLRGLPDVSARALEFVILTAVRTGEALEARWNEIDLDAATWTIPASRMKMRKEHVVPLSSAAIAVLQTMLQFKAADDGYVFPGRFKGTHMSDASMLMLLRRMAGEGGGRKRPDFTVHGFRSSFRDWAGEATAHPREVAEMALAHAVGNETERAYSRSALLQKRAKLMQDWADYCGKPKAEVASLAEARAARAQT